MKDFRIRPLHRQRTVRRSRVQVLDQQELAELLGVPIEGLRNELDKRGWSYHLDSAGNLWATLSEPP
ncbi:MAG: hypothetical protein GWM88_13825 [Pseudomonadales bacterium]|nr:hypothetical protein [Pseudomonadales bacterium]NIX09019.1 hypothetical protein [Pseudomonadales bacterium]